MTFRPFVVLLPLTLAAVSLSGAESQGERHWSAAQFQNLEKEIVAANAKGSGINVLLQDKNFRTVLLHRQDNSQVEVHEQLAEFYIVQGGSGTIVVGGTAKDLKPTDAGELRGDTLDGGLPYSMSVGDMLYVPANTPHKVLVKQGQSLDTIVVKIVPR